MFYIDTYHDRFFVAPPRWFIAYAWMEAVYHLPLSLWVVGGLWRGEFLFSFLVFGYVGFLRCDIKGLAGARMVGCNG